MSFFYALKSKLNNISLTSLPYQLKKTNFLKKFKIFMQNGKRASLFIFCKKGMLTIEAACIFPIFLTACMSVLFFAELFRLEVRMDEALFNVAKVYAQYMGIKSETGIDNRLIDLGVQGIGILAISNTVEKDIGNEFLEKSVLSDGVKSLSFIRTSISDEFVDVTVTYKVKFKLPFISFLEIPMAQRCRIHTWSGKENIDENSDDETMVFITPTGSVYHTDRNCTYIDINVLKTGADDISEKRNESGAKYYPCEKCTYGKEINNQVFYTNDGTRYHNDLNCSSLKRTVYEVKLSEIEKTRRPCSKCTN